MRRAVLIGKVVDLKAAEASTFANTLDGLSAGVFLLDGLARIVHANVAGRDMLRIGGFLREANGRLVALNAQTDQVLQASVRAAEHGDAGVGVQGIAVPLIAANGEHYVAHLLPLRSGTRSRTRVADAAVSALFVHRAAVETPSKPEVIAKAYQLTPTELRVLLALAEIGGGPKVAEALGISGGTVKTHLKHLFQKTGVKNQADLVKLVAGFNNPLLH